MQSSPNDVITRTFRPALTSGFGMTHLVLMRVFWGSTIVEFTCSKKGGIFRITGVPIHPEPIQGAVGLRFKGRQLTKAGRNRQGPMAICLQKGLFKKGLPGIQKSHLPRGAELKTSEGKAKVQKAARVLQTCWGWLRLPLLPGDPDKIEKQWEQKGNMQKHVISLQHRLFYCKVLRKQIQSLGSYTRFTHFRANSLKNMEEQHEKRHEKRKFLKANDQRRGETLCT